MSENSAMVARLDRNGADREETEKLTLELTSEKGLEELEMMPVDESKQFQPETKLKPPLDNNIYSTKKTVAQGMMDIALLSSNASQLQLILKYREEKTSIVVIHIVCLCISIILQILVGVLLIINSRYNINRQSHQSRADLLNNMTVVGIFLITVSNVIASSFGESN